MSARPASARRAPARRRRRRTSSFDPAPAEVPRRVRSTSRSTARGCSRGSSTAAAFGDGSSRARTRRARSSSRVAARRARTRSTSGAGLGRSRGHLVAEPRAGPTGAATLDRDQAPAARERELRAAEATARRRHAGAHDRPRAIEVALRRRRRQARDHDSGGRRPGREGRRAVARRQRRLSAGASTRRACRRRRTASSTSTSRAALDEPRAACEHEDPERAIKQNLRPLRSHGRVAASQPSGARLTFVVHDQVVRVASGSLSRHGSARVPLHLGVGHRGPPGQDRRPGLRLRSRRRPADDPRAASPARR